MAHALHPSLGSRFELFLRILGQKVGCRQPGQLLSKWQRILEQGRPAGEVWTEI